MNENRGLLGLITWLYYHKMEPASEFYEQIMGFEPVEDQGWAKIYRTHNNAYLGIVAGRSGFHEPRSENSILVTVVVDDVSRWYEELTKAGVKMLRELEDRPDIGIRCFFIEDPGGYTLEIQQFLRPGQIEVFGG